MDQNVSFSQLRELLIANRSVRRFDESHPVSDDDLHRLVELVRYTASGRNAQPLRYRCVTDETRENVFPLLAWAGYYKDWNGPEKGERPAAYLVQCLDTTYGENCLCDDGLQLEALTLGACALGLGCCIIKAFDARALAEVLQLPGHLRPRYVLAIGKAAEDVVLESTNGTPDADIRYFRTTDGAHHVPKRPLMELLV